MKAYEAALKAGDTRLLLSPDSEFFQYFNSSMGKGASQGSGGQGSGGQGSGSQRDQAPAAPPEAPQSSEAAPTPGSTAQGSPGVGAAPAQAQ
jgi:modulator of FtsH protease HflC